MGLRSDEEKRPFLQERRQVDGLAGLWALIGSALGGSAMLDPAVAAGTVPLGIVCGVFAYSFKRRKAACDEVIDDPPRNDYTISTRPQRDWFDPERLDDVLNPVQVRLCKLLAEGTPTCVQPLGQTSARRAPTPPRTRNTATDRQSQATLSWTLLCWYRKRRGPSSTEIWAKDNRIVAVRPNAAFANYFTAASEVRATHPKADADDEATKAGATGVQPSSGTPSRSALGARRLTALSIRRPTIERSACVTL
jgi:hypothetical protein